MRGSNTNCVAEVVMIVLGSTGTLVPTIGGALGEF